MSSQGLDTLNENEITELLHLEDHVIVELLFMPVIEYYYKNYNRKPMGKEWGVGWSLIKRHIYEDPVRCHNLIRMDNRIFESLCQKLQCDYGLRNTKHICVDESVAIFLMICAHNMVQRFVAIILGHSQETINRKFHEVLKACFTLAGELIPAQSQEDLQRIPQALRSNEKYWPYFRGFIGAMDGTHVPVKLQKTEASMFWNRHGYTSLNILAICDLNMLFKYAWIGVPGFAHEARVLMMAMTDDPIFPKPPQEKYYLVDSGYANKQGFLAPFRGGPRYHLQQFRTSGPPRNQEEMFNKLHSSLRSVIERTFGVWKKKWRILDDHPRYNKKIQNKVIQGTMALHNFIRTSQIPDIDFNHASNDNIGGQEEDNEGHRTIQGEERNVGQYMQIIRNEIASMIWASHH